MTYRYSHTSHHADPWPASVRALRDRGPERRRTDVVLESGSLLLMWGRSQREWQHSIPRTRAAIGPRINLTFRSVETGS